jgi:hypothetical protein
MAVVSLRWGAVILTPTGSAPKLPAQHPNGTSLLSGIENQLTARGTHAIWRPAEEAGDRFISLSNWHYSVVEALGHIEGLHQAATVGC